MLADVILEPIHGEFDANKLRMWLDQRETICVDPLGTGAYMVGGSADMVEALKMIRTGDPSWFPPCVLVTINPRIVMISQEWGDKDQREIACEFAKAVFAEGNCVVRDQAGNDLTEHVRKEGMDALF
jgi:hypothetical protein